MPIYEPDLSYEDMWARVRTHCCAECEAQLTIAWSALNNCYMLRCGRSLEHEGIKRPYDPGPYDIPGFNLFNLKGRRKPMAEKIGNQASKELAPYTGIVSLTKDQAAKILSTIWPNAPDLEVFKAALICKEYGLNPLMQHVFLVPFRRKEGVSWATIVGIKATRLIASRSQHYSYLNGTPRVMTEQEQKDILGESDPKNIWAITKLQAQDGSKAQGYGNWPKDQDPYGVDKGNTKAKMAFIRSERDALNRLFPGEMPQGVEIADEDFIPIGEEPANEKGKEPQKPQAKEGTKPLQGDITPAQRQKIFATARQMGYTNGDVKAIIQAKWRVEHTDDLTKAQSSELIDFLERGERLGQEQPPPHQE